MLGAMSPLHTELEALVKNMLPDRLPSFSDGLLRIDSMTQSFLEWSSFSNFLEELLSLRARCSSFSLFFVYQTIWLIVWLVALGLRTF